MEHSTFHMFFHFSMGLFIQDCKIKFQYALRQFFIYVLQDKHLDSSLDIHGLDPDQRWGSKYSVFLYSMSCFCSQDATSKFLASFIKLVLRKAKTLESVVIWLGRDIYFDKVKWFEEHPQMVRTLSHYNNVSIELKRSIY